MKSVQTIFGTRIAGLACDIDNSIVVADGDWVEGMIRHELAHLFTARCNRYAPPFLNEGFANWWQLKHDTPHADACAHHYVRHARLSIGELAVSTGFYERKWLTPAYAVAGSFTGFLIRRYGKARYRDFYRQATPESLERFFHDHFGTSLTEAEARWRNEISTIMVLRQRLERTLNC